MMTKMTTPNPVVNRQSSYKTGRQSSASSSITETGVDFGKIVDRRLEEKTQNSKTYSTSTAQSGNASGHEVQAKYAYDDVDPARMEQLRQNAQNASKEKLSDKPELQDFDDEEMEQIAALAASLQNLTANSKANDDDTDKLSTISAIFNDVLDGIKEGALSVNGTALKNSVDKMKDLLETLKNGGMPEDITEENSSKLMELMTLLLNELGTGTEEGKLGSAKDLGKQLLETLNGLLGNQNDEANSVESNNIIALMQQIVAKTNLLMKGEQAAIAKDMAKKDFSAKLHETMDAILTAASQKDMDDAALKTMIEKLVSDLFAGAGTSNDKNNSTINGILQKYGLLDSEGGKSINKLGLDELKARIANALMMLAEKVGNESDEKSKKGLDFMDKFSKVLDDNLTGKGIEKQQSNGLAGEGKKDAGLNEDKLLNKFLGKDTSDTDNKTNKINSLISQINNSKNDIEAEKVVEKPVITKGNFSQDIVKTVRYMNLNNLKELTVKIAPKELGEITIKLTMTDGVMKANISANSKEAFNLLTTNVGEIKSSLENNTIKIQDVDINIYQEDASFNRDNANRQQNNQSNKNHNTNSQGQIDISDTIENTTEANVDNNISILI